MCSEHLFRTLDAIQMQVRAFDTKAQIVLGVDGIILGFLSLNGTAISAAVARRFPAVLAIGLGLAYTFALFTLVFSLYYVFATVRPRTAFGQPPSRLFFFHLTARYGCDYEGAKKDLAAMTEDEIRGTRSSPNKSSQTPMSVTQSRPVWVRHSSGFSCP